MSETIDQMISEIIAHEGGAKFAETPGDAGGATKYGISLRFVQGIPGAKFDLNGDGVTDARDIQLIDYDRAAGLYRQYFYQMPMIYTLEPNIQPMIFDEAVNMGTVHAIGCLQKAVLVPADGHIGELTRTSLTAVVNRLGRSSVQNLIVDQFVARYHAIVAANPGQEKFLNGWLNRANSWRPK